MIIGKKQRESAVINRKNIIDLLRRNGQLSQRQLCDLTGLHRSTLSKLISWLTDNGFVEEAGINPAPTGGKRQTLLRLCGEKRYTLGIGLYARRFCWVFMALNGDIVDSGEFDFDGSLESIHQPINKLIENSSFPISAVCLGLPGIIDPENGIIVRSGFWDVKSLPLVEQLQDKVSAPLFIDNDVRLMAELECNPNVQMSLYIGINKNLHDAKWRLGGFGSAIMNNGKIISGSNSAAGEIYGFTDIVAGQAPLICSDDLKTLAQTKGEVTSELEELIPWLGRILIHLSAIIDPKEIILGGAATIQNSRFIELLNQFVQEKHFIYCPGRKLLVKPAKHPDTNMPEGAAHAAFDRLDTDIL